MPECKVSILVALPTVMLVLLVVGGVHLLTMERLHKDVKELEVIDREIFYLDTKIEQLRQMIAPVVLRGFWIQNTTEGVEVLYRDRVVWKGDPHALNTTYTVEYFGKVIITNRDGKVVVTTEDGVFKYYPKGKWDQGSAYFVDYVMKKLKPLIESSSSKKAERQELQEKISRTRQGPYVLVFLAMPLVSILAMYMVLSRIGLGRDYAELFRSPYMTLPTAMVYVILIYLTYLYHTGILLPVHVFLILYALLSIPSIAALLLYYHEACAE
ncbi:MAG: hypothetical protein QI197_08360 [Candidatus Korarchaeota archaeon]|nr:hypothetical protein [Candidatus Korarchaeota archaeon]